MYANVLIEYPIKTLDKVFTYRVPAEMQKEIKVGMKVTVPFNVKEISGIVMSLTTNNPGVETKEISKLVMPFFTLNEEQMAIGKFLKEETLCPLITAFQTMLPSSLKINNKTHDLTKYDTYIKLNDNYNDLENYIIKNNRFTKQIAIINSLKNKGIDLKSNYNISSVNTLLNKNIIIEEKKKHYRINVNKKNTQHIKMNEEQQKVFNSVDLNTYKTYLLQGVTGSGKTLVYMELIDKVIQMGKKAIVLVPEICLTTQTVERFYQRFGNDVAIFHSALSEGEKFDEYQKIYNDEIKIVIGTRSSIFVPLKNLGLIVIDEEHSDTYIQENVPRYNAIEVAKFRCQMNNIPLLLASATPSLESRSRATKGVYQLLRLDKRANSLLMPNINIIDMKKEYHMPIFSAKLIEEMIKRITNHEQIILLLNRRGFSTIISCHNCGYTYKCPNCDITLTYHKTSNKLRCHYCGYAINKDTNCPECHNNSLSYLGLGTEKVEEELHKIIPNAKIIRMDQDTTTKKGSYQKIIDDFASHKYDILLGTQMISKGLDFKDVTLVGVINADASLNIPDYKASEKTFQLLYQTAGRCGRFEKQGDVFIQTYNPDYPIFKYLINNNYDKFYEYEMHNRHALKYSPYTYLLLIKISSSNYELIAKEANEIKKTLLSHLDKNTLVMGPTPAPVFRINNIYTFQVVVKYTKENNLKSILKNIDEIYETKKNLNIGYYFNPSHF